MSADFAELSAAFVEAAGADRARIAILVDRSAVGDKHLPRFLAAWNRFRPRIESVMPDPGGQTLGSAALRTLAMCTGIFVCGGDTRIYHQLYGTGSGRQAILERIACGVPYAGSSAGALIAPEAALVWGDRVTRKDHTLYLGGAEGPCDAELDVEPGLALVPAAILEAHFTAQGGFPRLLAALTKSDMRYGLGVDDGVCLEVLDRVTLRVHGHGRLYLLERANDESATVRALGPEASMRLVTDDQPPSRPTHAPP